MPTGAPKCKICGVSHWSWESHTFQGAEKRPEATPAPPPAPAIEPNHGSVAQRLELAAHNGPVAGSNPAAPTTPVCETKKRKSARKAGKTPENEAICDLSVKKRGRPSLGEPWKAAGISRVTYFRRKKSGKLEGKDGAS
jgi:hypothetical protein